MTEAIQPHMLPSALDGFPDVRVLSLDCFDTLIWRDTHAPKDIFSRLPGVSLPQRTFAEEQARKSAMLGKNRNEVSIGEIYALLMPNASPAERREAIEAEIAAEARHCFAFAPTVELMREAKSRGMQVVIVSDTYFDSSQLRDLIARAAGEEVAGLIDRLFCSSSFGKAKAGGLYGEVLRKLKAKPEEILHIGDNPHADVAGVAPFGVNTLHLRQFSEQTEQRLRLESAVSAMIHPDDGDDAAALQPYRATLAAAEPGGDDAAENLGLTALGPVLFGFENWLQAEADALRERHGGTVHWLFLMRDGHLPKLVHEVSGDCDHSHAIEISRFTATASSFTCDRDIQSYAELELGIRPETLARQLLIPEAEIASVVGGMSPLDASYALLGEMRKGQRRKQTLRASRAYASRLVAHVRRVVNPAEGDVLMFVDLGYNGTVQNRIDALLADALKVHVAGRYLLLRETDCPGLDKRGFLGTDNYDVYTVEAMCANVAVLEQLCTTTMGSVIDYTEDGEPIRRGSDIKDRQSEVRDRIQAGCLRYMREQRDIVVRAEAADDVSLWRKAAATALTRLMYLPLEQELAVIERFEHDVNLGTDRKVALFDPDEARRGLRRRGLFYMKGANRMYLPAELKGHGLGPKLTLFAHKRFGLPFSFGDFSDSRISLPVVFADQDDVAMREVTATATHDGYFLAAIPVGDCRYSAALQFGALFEWLQIDSVRFLPVEDFMSELRSSSDNEIPAEPLLENMEQVAPYLFHCANETSFMMVHPPRREDDRPLMLAVVFRPLVERIETPAQVHAPVPVAALAEARA
ncbi:MAG: HAD family hydrolase [Novosphingobium sp.]|nr:HAD family hydrolase [Novosphingobium sp.]